jgi:hypothetical protein
VNDTVVTTAAFTQILQENVAVISTMRENLLSGRLMENYQFMHKVYMIIAHAY